MSSWSGRGVAEQQFVSIAIQRQRILSSVFVDLSITRAIPFAPGDLNDPLAGVSVTPRPVMPDAGNPA
jgi:hypothetical protein